MEQQSQKDSIKNRTSSSQAPQEGEMTKAVEKVTAQVPSMTWLWLAGGSFVISAGIALFTERKSAANFVGLWVPSLLLIGIYNKLVKLEGSDRFDREAMH